MKQYHTKITINKSIQEVWQELINFENYPNWNPLVGKLRGEMQEGSKIETFIVPLGKSFFPILLSYKDEQELIWEGKRFAKFLLAGKHYYKLEKIDENSTEFLHGEYFTGWFSYFIPKSLLKRMENTFIEHNQKLKEIVENGR